MEEDLRRFRAVNPKATRTEVLRAWSRASNRDRYVAQILELQTLLQEAKDSATAAIRSEEAARREREAVSKKLDQAMSRLAGPAGGDDSLNLALRAIAAPNNAHIRRELAQMVALEAAGGQPIPANPLLRRARSHLPSWEALHRLSEPVSP